LWRDRGAKEGEGTEEGACNERKRRKGEERRAERERIEGRSTTEEGRKGEGRKEHPISGRKRLFAAFCRDFEKGVGLTVFFEIGDDARRGRRGIKRGIPCIECLPKVVWLRVLSDLNDGKTFEVLKVFDSTTIFETPFKEKGSAIPSTPQIERRGSGKDEGASLVEEGGARGTSSGLWRDFFEDNGVW